MFRYGEKHMPTLELPLFKCVPAYVIFTIADRFGSHDPNSMGVICSDMISTANQWWLSRSYTSYTVASGESSAVELEPTGRESAQMSGNGIWNDCHACERGMCDQS
jgi:hypothetical protein